MKLTTLLAALAVTFGFVQSAQARVHHRQRVSQYQLDHHRVAHRQAHRQRVARHHARTRVLASRGESEYRAERYARPAHTARDAYASSAPDAYGGRYGRRPAAWCGWQMRHLVSSDPGPSFNLARNWAGWGHAGPVGVGAVVVWPHHVGKIVGQEGGMWVIESGNDGHALRTRPRSIAGAIAIRWG